VTFERGFLRKPAVTRLLDRWAEEEEALRIKERNDLIYRKAIDNFFRRTDEDRPCQ
jgi:hypothetical protein